MRKNMFQKKQFALTKYPSCVVVKVFLFYEDEQHAQKILAAEIGRVLHGGVYYMMLWL